MPASELEVDSPFKALGVCVHSNRRPTAQSLDRTDSRTPNVFSAAQLSTSETNSAGRRTFCVFRRDGPRRPITMCEQ